MQAQAQEDDSSEPTLGDVESLAQCALNFGDGVWNVHTILRSIDRASGRARCGGLDFLLHAFEELVHHHAGRRQKNALANPSDHTAHLSVASNLDERSIFRVAQGHKSGPLHEPWPTRAFNVETIARGFVLVGYLDISTERSSNRRNFERQVREIPPIGLEDQ